MRRLLAIAAVLLCALVPVLVLAQAADEPASGEESLLDILARASELNAEEQRSGFIAFVENQISSPDRQIRLSNVEGVLSSQASIGQITIADTEGIWLIIENARIDWNQGALLLGRLEIRELAADSIAYIRNPLPPEAPGGPAPEASGGFSVPEFPVAVILESLSIPSISFGEQVFGLGSEIALSGAMTLEGGTIDADLDIERLDGPGGTLALDLVYSNETRIIDLDLILTEPENGIVANLLNIEGRPEIELGLSGSGAIEDLEVALTFDADGERILEGMGTLGEVAGGLEIAADLGGPIAAILPAPYRPFFGERTQFSLRALIAEEGGIDLEAFSLSGGQLSLAATGQTGPDGFLTRLELDGEINPGAADRVILPVPGADTTLERARFAIDFGAQGGENWTGTLQVIGYETPQYSARDLAINASGVAADLEDPANRRITFNADGALEGIETASEEIAQALGQSIGLGIAGLWQAGEPVTLAQLRVVGEALTFEASGEIDDAVFDGDIALSTSSLAPFSGLAGRALAGSMELAATGTLSPLAGGFDLTVDGNATGLTLDQPTLDALLQGEVALSGRLARDESGLTAEDFFLGNERVSLEADGTIASQTADFTFDAVVADLGLLSGDASGRLSATGSARGADGRIELGFTASVPEGSLDGRALRNAQIAFDGVNADNTLTGTVSGSAMLDGFTISLGADIDNTPERLRLTSIDFDAPGTSLTGDLTRSADGLIDGRLTLDAPNIETAAALALLEARGAVEADIVLSTGSGRQQASIEAFASGLTLAEASVGEARIALEVDDLFGVPVIDGTIAGENIAAAGVVAETLQLAATSSEQTTRFNGTARLEQGTDIGLEGSLSPIPQGYSMALSRFSLTQGALETTLAAPVELTVAEDEVRFSGLELTVGSGRLTATGTAGETLDIAVTASAIPLSIANTVAPDLALSGTVSGTAQVTGPAGDPRASFTLEGSGIDAAALGPLGIAPVSFTANGSYAGGTIALQSASAQGSGGLSATASGTIPLDGPGLDVTVNGTAPLSLANRWVAERGAQISGNASAQIRLTGSLSSPQYGGTVSVSGGQYVDPELALNLTGITGSATLTGTQLQIASLSAQLATGGSVSASGTLGLDAPALTSNLTFVLDNARYADGDLVVATLNGQLNLSGPIGRGGTLSGNIAVARADILIPESIGGPGALIDVRHVNTPAYVLRSLARLQTGGGGGGERAGAPAPGVPLALDITLSAPNQVFLRGRGLDAEVGGQVRLTGNIANIQPVGGFELIRGRLAILGQRIDFDSGSLTLIGDLDPFVDLVARIEGADITVIVTVAGRVSSPDIFFSSDPMLPEDEVLSRLIFNRSVGELSPLQIARLAAAAAELAGGGGGGSLVDNLREAAGLDDLDVVVDDEGNAALRAGRYIDDNIYLGVEAGAGGESRVTIDLDVTDNLTARGAAGTDGNSSLGLFYEQDY